MPERDYTVSFQWAYSRPNIVTAGYPCYLFISSDGDLISTTEFDVLGGFEYKELKFSITATTPSAELEVVALCGYETSTGDFSGAVIAFDDFSVKDVCIASTPSPTPVNPTPANPVDPGATCGPQILKNPGFEEANGQDSNAGDWIFPQDSVEIRTNDPDAGEDDPRANSGENYL